MLGDQPRVKKLSRHHDHQSSVRAVRSNKVIHTTIGSLSTTSRSANNTSLDPQANLHMFSAILSARDHRDELQKSSNIQSQTESSTHQTGVHRRSRSVPQEDISRRNHRNKISSKQDERSTGKVNKRKSKNKTPVLNFPETTNVSSDRMGIVEDQHNNLNSKKKKKCSRLCVVGSILVGVALVIVAVILLVVFLTKSKTQDNMPTGNYTLRWNTTGITVAGVVAEANTTSDHLNRPFGVAIDYDNTLYISDFFNNRLQRWSKGASAGTTIDGQANGTVGGTSSYLKSPASILLDSNSNIYVADSGNSRVQFLSTGATTGVTIAGNGTGGNPNGQLNITYGIARDSSSGVLYVADFNNHRVLSYASGASLGIVVAGNHISGPNSTQLSYPTGLYFDFLSNSLIIVNYMCNNIVRWTLGASSWTLVAGDINGLSGNTSTTLNKPIGMAIDPMGNVYVADTQNHRIQLFLVGQSDATTIAGVGVVGQSSTLLNRPYSVALDNQLNLYVVDTFNHRIQMFTRY